MREQAHKDAIELAVERWNAHDERYYELYADDAPIHGLPGIPETVDGMRGLFQQMWTSFPDVRVDLLHVAAEGDLLAAHFRVSGTHEGEFLGASPTGNRIGVEAMGFFRFGPEGKAVERWTRLDEVALLTQLGLMPAPAAAPA
jgi:predicted ester cyclase